jgi:hypothetical protein
LRFKCHQLHHKEEGITWFQMTLNICQLTLLEISEDLRVRHHCGKNHKSYCTATVKLIVFTRTPNITGATLKLFIEMHIQLHISATLSHSHIV